MEYFTVVVFHPEGEATYTSKGLDDTAALVDMIFTSVGGSYSDKKVCLNALDPDAYDPNMVTCINSDLIEGHSILIENGPAPGLIER